MNQITLSTLTKTVELSGDQGPLGIHVVPYCSSLSGRMLGLHIRGIEESSRCQREDIFHTDECVVRINDTELIDKTFPQSQDVFRQAMASPVVRLEVLPVANKHRYEKSLIGQLFTAEGHDPAPRAKSPLLLAKGKNNFRQDVTQDVKPDVKPDVTQEVKREERQPEVQAKTPESAALPATAGEPPSGSGPVENAPPSVSPTPPDAPPPSATRGRSASPQPKKSAGLPGLVNLASKKGGKRLKIDLKKGTDGLGFTVVTRDPSIPGPRPILVKNILPRGAAIKDGRLQPGDRILEVNGVDMAGRSQEELVAMLRSTRQGESVCVVVSRQEDIFIPRELKGEEAGSVVLEEGLEQLVLEVPLNDSGSAGLGVSLKGNRARDTGEDLGIFIKSIIHGGAAYKDGRLRVNDQLVGVNGEALLGRSNHVAMETLRRSMSSEGTARGTIQLVLLRPLAPAPGPAQVRPGPAAQSSSSSLRRQGGRGSALRHRYTATPPPDAQGHAPQADAHQRPLGSALASHALDQAHRSAHASAPDNTHQRTHADRYTHQHTQGHTHQHTPDNRLDRDAHTPGNTHRYSAYRYAHGPANGYTHDDTRNRTHADTHRHTHRYAQESRYTDNIREMAELMYGEAHGNGNTQRYTNYVYTHNQEHTHSNYEHTHNQEHSHRLTNYVYTHNQEHTHSDYIYTHNQERSRQQLLSRAL